MPSRYCTHCGRHADDCPGGLWRVNFGRSRADGYPVICLYCARSAIRFFGEQPDPKPVEPVSIIDPIEPQPGPSPYFVGT